MTTSESATLTDTETFGDFTVLTYRAPDDSIWQERTVIHGSGTDIAQQKAAAKDAAHGALLQLIAEAPAQLAQGQTDLVTLAASNDLLAPIVARVVAGSLELAKGLIDALTILEVIPPA